MLHARAAHRLMPTAMARLLPDMPCWRSGAGCIPVLLVEA